MEMKLLIFGYARVSSKDQNPARQLKELEEFGCERIYQEKGVFCNLKG